MGLPYTLEENFETGSTSFDQGEVDTQGRLTIRRYNWFPRNGINEVPHRGAYAAVVDLSVGTNDAYYNHAAMNIANDTTSYFRFYAYAQDLTMAANDRFTIFRLVQTSGAEEAVVDFRLNGDTSAYQVGISETNTCTTVGFVDFTLGQWHSIEITSYLDDGTENNGTLVMFVDGANVAELTCIDQAAITDGHWGVMNQDAGTTAGFFVLDDFVWDDGRIYPVQNRFSHMVTLTKTGHAFVGPGKIASVTLTGTAGDEEMAVYDSDQAANGLETGEANEIMPKLRIGASDDVTRSFPGGRYVEKGCYVTLSGTEPVATIEICEAQGTSVAGIQNLGMRRV